MAAKLVSLAKSAKSFSFSPKGVQSILSTTRLSFSTAYGRVDQVNQPGGEARSRSNGDELDRLADHGRSHRRDDQDSNRDIHIDSISGMTGFVADTARQGLVIKGSEMLEGAADTAKEAMDTAWDTTKKATQSVRDTKVANADENVVDTVEYRSTIPDVKVEQDLDAGVRRR